MVVSEKSHQNPSEYIQFLFKIRFEFIKKVIIFSEKMRNSDEHIYEYACSFVLRKGFIIQVVVLVWILLRTCKYYSKMSATLMEKRKINTIEWNTKDRFLTKEKMILKTLRFLQLFSSLKSICNKKRDDSKVNQID